MNINRSFSNAPTTVRIPRTMFDRSSRHSTDFSAGDLIPLYVDEYMPGDTFKIDISALVRSTTPIHPVMDDAFVDVWAFSVPNRVLWTNWVKCMGENTDAPWAVTSPPSVPTLAVKKSVNKPGSLLDYLGVPPDVGYNSGTAPKEAKISQLPIRAYIQIWNYFFRDENLSAPADVETGDNALDQASSGASSSDPLIAAKWGTKLLPVAKFHDYFTSCLPDPQKGNPSTVVGEGNMMLQNFGTPGSAVQFETDLGDTGTLSIAGSNPWTVKGNLATASSGDLITNFPNLGVSGADLQITINDLRESIAVQHVLEADARGGSRYPELIKAHYNVLSPLDIQQRPELLGHASFRVGMNQVLQTSSTDAVSPQGNTAAYSLTAGNRHLCSKSFTEHGILMIVGAVRARHTYAQGLERMWKRFSRYDYYFPELANISEQPVKNSEIYWQANSTDDQTFGFQEAWADYRMKPNRVSAHMRPQVSNSLASWNYADSYASLPTLSSAWIVEPKDNIDRTLVVGSANAPQFFGDFYFKCMTVRPMPIYSIPGLRTL